MSKLTRYFLIGSIGFLIVGLSIGLLAYFNGGLKALTRSWPDELQYVPKDAVVVSYANVHQIMNSEFRQRIKELEAGKTERGQQEFRDETGIDIEKDIDTVFAYMTAESPDATSPGNGVVMASGRFDQNRIGDLVTRKGGTVEKRGGKTFMTFGGQQGQQGSGHRGALVFLGSNQVAIGSLEAVQRIVDGTATQAGSITSNPDMMRLIGQVDSGNAWVVGRFDALSSHAHLPPQVTSQIPPIKWFSASGTIDGGLAGTLSVEANNATAAENLLKVVEGLKGLAALQAGSHNVPPQVQQVLNSFTFSQHGETVTLSFSISSDALNALAFGKKDSGASRK